MAFVLKDEALLAAPEVPVAPQSGKKAKLQSFSPALVAAGVGGTRQFL